MRLAYIFLLFCAFSQGISAQTAPLPLGKAAPCMVERLEIITGVSSEIDGTSAPIGRKELTEFALRMDSMESLGAVERRDLDYIFKDNNEWLAEPDVPLSLTEKKREDKYRFNNDAEHPKYATTKRPFLRYFYKTPANFFETGNENFYLKLNPIINIGADRGASGRTLFTNARGFEMRGGLDNRIFFYTNLIETQRRFPVYVDSFIQQFDAVPQNGLFKRYRSSVIDSDGAYDYLNAQGYVGFNATPHLSVLLGHGRNFIGSGYRSMLLSDFSQNYFHLKLNWKIADFHYQNLFAELNGTTPNTVAQNELVQKKYMAAHYLNYQPSSNFSVGIYEAVVFNRNSETGHFELQYLNPIIFYRSVESLIGSPDNVLLGTNVKWNFLKRFQLYGQVMIDEFKFKEWVSNNRNWWGNKVGSQVGIKAINAAGINGLDLQAEWNIVRPYTYSHRDTFGASYAHNAMSLAHPLGANFREVVLLGKYRFAKRFSLNLRYIRAQTGGDSNGSNWGGNVLLPNTSREQDFSNEIGQGVATDINLFAARLEYELMHNTAVYLQTLVRNQTSDLASRTYDERYVGFGFRMNITPYNLDF